MQDPIPTRCPKCGHHIIVIKAEVSVTVDGGDPDTDSLGDPCWDKDSLCICQACDHEAPVKNFVEDRRR